MPVSKPVSDLRHKAQEISRLCHQARMELYRLLDEAEEDFRAGDRGTTVEAMRERLRG